MKSLKKDMFIQLIFLLFQSRYQR